VDDKILDPDGARERMAAWKGRIDQLAATTQAMSDRLQQVRVTTRDPRGMAELTVDSTGALVDLRLTDKIHDVDPATVASTIMSTLRAAKSEVADRSQEIIAETVGTESPAARAIADSVDRHLREGSAAPEPDDDEQDFDIRSHLSS
jgi:DNA-binding protein YbaB